ncbi:P-loop containing nucleoside triphosphate hydrolase protein [Fusarium flagelliforme]|uniref:Adenylate kinase n=1 Tax=Fusarium flagelliforme TaxID=2675880 RepID=A0A395N1G6_9HYPO|nr:P-loop containing nucleoside triphosphate hydrolase protein [Fusarium flagelliforme]KAH7173243.1 P-loop containing nucleoside triphosphate hydrolase protein [Fusarium flagelliforme]RFN53966.1 adenylate kinase [Fusarium flagelliforme]
MHLQSKSGGQSRHFAIIFILGAPGAGKGTLATHLAQKHNLVHYSVGDGLRAWMRENRSTELAATIQSKLDNQGFLTSEDLNPFIYQQILDAINRDGPDMKGILVDGYPRCIEQLDSFGTWPFQHTMPLAPGSDGKISLDIKPDLVLSFQVLKQNAKERYMRRARDSNDSADKFEKRFSEYEVETLPVEEEYRRRDVLVPVDVNGTKEENVKVLTETLRESEIWGNVIKLEQ